MSRGLLRQRGALLAVCWRRRPVDPARGSAATAFAHEVNLFTGRSRSMLLLIWTLDPAGSSSAGVAANDGWRYQHNSSLQEGVSCHGALSRCCWTSRKPG